MKSNSPYVQKYPIEFEANPNTSFINYRAKDTRTPYEQYEAGEKWIYVDLRDIGGIFKDMKPETLTREEYYNKYLNLDCSNYYPRRNIKLYNY